MMTRSAYTAQDHIVTVFASQGPKYHARTIILPGAGLNRCSILRASGVSSCQLLRFHIMKRSARQKTAPCT